MARRRTLGKHYYNNKSKRRRTRNMRKMKGGLAGVNFGTFERNFPLLTGIARGVRFLSRETVALFANHPEMAMLKRYATAFHDDYLSRINAYAYKQSTHSFWWAERRLFEAYYSDRLRKEHSQEEKHEITIKQGMYTVATKTSEDEDKCYVKEQDYQELLQQESAEFKALGEEVNAVSNDKTYSTYYLYFSNSTLQLIKKLTGSDSEEDVLKKYVQIAQNMVALAEAIDLVLNSKGMKAIGQDYYSQCKLKWQIYDYLTDWFHEQDDAFKDDKNNNALYEIKLYIVEIIQVVEKGIERLTKKIERKSQGKSQTVKEDDTELAATWKDTEAKGIAFNEKLEAAKQATEAEAPGSTEQRQEGAPGSTEQTAEPTTESIPKPITEPTGGKYLDGIMRKKHTKKRQIRRKRMRPSRK